MIAYDKLVITKPWELKLQSDEIDESNIPDGWVLVKKLYTIISAGTEIACLSGEEGWFPLPGVPGYGGVCQVVAKAEDVEGFSCGDIVYCRAKHSAYELIQAEELQHIPEGIDHQMVPFARMAGISASSTRVSGIEFGDDVVVIGQGMVGNFAMQLAQIQGANVIAVDTSNLRLELAKQCGARHTLNPMEGDTGEAIANILGGRQVTTLIDATGNARVISENVKHIAWGGEMILLGSPREEYAANVTEVLRHIHMGKYNITMKGAHEKINPDLPGMYMKHSVQRTIRIILEYLADGRVQAKPLLSHIIKPKDVPQIYERLRQRDQNYVGVLVDWND